MKQKVQPHNFAIFVARQPIFNRHKELFGYEILFRNGFENFYNALDADVSTSKTLINSFLVIGTDSLTGGRRAFINFTETTLKTNLAYFFPKEVLTIEILETVPITSEIIAIAKKLKSQGYKIALDDFVFSDEYRELLPFADIIKVDFLNTTTYERLQIHNETSHLNIKLLAEKIETYEDFHEALSLGYVYFQGYFFSQPEIIESRDIPVYKLNYLEILQQIHKDDVDFGKLEEIIKRDVSLSFKLLKFINSAAFGFASQIGSIKHALSLLGIREFKNWLSFVVLHSIAQDKPQELIVTSLIRAKFAELLASSSQFKAVASECFLMGLFSLVDAFFDKEKKEIFGQLPLADEIKNAILYNKGPYSGIFRFITAYEKGNWEQVNKISHELQMPPEQIAQSYRKAIEWANKFFVHQ
jgi:EAL and modified HD-GYP domain-containing signal transduction protein